MGEKLKIELITNKASIKSQKYRAQSFQVGGHLHTKKVPHPNSTGTEAPTLETLPHPALSISSADYSSVPVVVSFNKEVNVSLPPNFVCYSSRLIKLKEASLESLIYSWLV